MRKPELLIPAGDLETLKIAVAYGADAVYLGGEAFSLRAKAKNFSMEELREGIAFAHERKVRVYVAANVFAHGQELHGVESYFEKLRELKPDALILSDPGVIMLAKKLLPEAEIHISFVLVQTGSKQSGCCKGTELIGDPGDQGAHSCRSSDRVLCAWRHVHFLFGEMPFKQLLYRAGQQPWRVYSPLQMEIRRL